MRAGSRVDLRGLKCVGMYYRQVHLRNGAEYTEYNYRFNDDNGRTFFYAGRHYAIEPNDTCDLRATIKRVNRYGYDLARIKRLEPALDQHKLI